MEEGREGWWMNVWGGERREGTRTTQCRAKISCDWRPLKRRRVQHERSFIDASERRG